MTEYAQDNGRRTVETSGKDNPPNDTRLTQLTVPMKNALIKPLKKGLYESVRQEAERAGFCRGK
jgi:hypothetical protein